MNSAEAFARAQQLTEALYRGDPGVDGDLVLEEVEQLAAAVHADERGAEVALETMAVLAAHLVAQRKGDIQAMDDAASRATALRRRMSPGSILDVLAQLIVAAQVAIASNARHDLGKVREQADLIKELRSLLPPDAPESLPVRAQIDEMLAVMGILDSTVESTDNAIRGVDQWEIVLAPLREDVERADLEPARRASAYAELSGAAIGLFEASGLERYLDEAIEGFRSAVSTSREDDPRRVFYLLSLGGGLLREFQQRRNRSALDEALHVFEEASRIAVDAAHPQWPLLCYMYGQAERLAGRPAVASRIGQDGLRGQVWNALLENDPATARAIAHGAAEDAIEVAHWSVRSGDLDGGINALEAGRGLALQAATLHVSASDLLLKQGAIDLAERWISAVARRGAEDVPVDLRREVITKLEQSGALDRFWAAPTRPEVEEALHRLNIDALVYLVSGDGNRDSGFALIVPAVGPPVSLVLPGLFARPNGELDRYIAAATGQDQRELSTERARAISAERPHDRTWIEALDQVCDWAWMVAIGPLLDFLDTRLYLSPEQVPRLAIVAVGDLGRVPWQAARHRDVSGTTYAVQRAVFSTAVSARMICESAYADERPISTSGLVIGDPDTGGAAAPLPAARREALAVKRVFLSGGLYMGREDDGTSIPDRKGTRAEIEQWLAHPADDRGAVLHLACHGVVQSGTARTDSSYLLLAGGERLAAEDLARMTSSKQQGLGLVVLAACHSGVPGLGYDESFSLASAFLASGARTVVSARWALPDSASSVLMFMFHHYLYVLGMSPADALRSAQLWMLDVDRVAPPTMPAPLVATIHNASDIIAWAGVDHSGR